MEMPHGKEVEAVGMFLASLRNAPTLCSIKRIGVKKTWR